MTAFKEPKVFNMHYDSICSLTLLGRDCRTTCGAGSHYGFSERAERYNEYVRTNAYSRKCDRCKPGENCSAVGGMILYVDPKGLLPSEFVIVCSAPYVVHENDYLSNNYKRLKHIETEGYISYRYFSIQKEFATKDYNKIVKIICAEGLMMRGAHGLSRRVKFTSEELKRFFGMNETPRYESSTRRIEIEKKISQIRLKIESENSENIQIGLDGQRISNVVQNVPKTINKPVIERTVAPVVDVLGKRKKNESDTLIESLYTQHIVPMKYAEAEKMLKDESSDSETVQTSEIVGEFTINGKVKFTSHTTISMPIKKRKL